MRYLYKCSNDKCVNVGKTITINKPISESSKEEFCQICGSVLVRIYSVGAIKTGDGVK